MNRLARQIPLLLLASAITPSLHSANNPDYASRERDANSSTEKPPVRSKDKDVEDVLTSKLLKLSAQPIEDYAKANVQAANSLNKGGKEIPPPVGDRLLKYRKIGDDEEQRILRQRHKIKGMIRTTAGLIEQGIMPKVEAEGGDVNLRVAEQFRESVVKVNASIRSLALTIRVFKHLADSTRRDAESASGPRKSECLILHHAIIYELADLAVEMIDEFNHDGADQLRELYGERRESIRQLNKDNDEALKFSQQLARKGKITDAEAGVNLQRHEQGKYALSAVSQKWESTLAILGRQESSFEHFKKQRDRLELLKKQALVQLKMIREIGIARMAGETISEIDQLIDQVQKIELFNFSESEIRLMLGQATANSIEQVPETSKQLNVTQ